MSGNPLDPLSSYLVDTSFLEDSDATDDSQPIESNDIVTIDRKKAVYGSALAVLLLGCLALLIPVLLVGGNALKNIDSFMKMLFGLSLCGLCVVAFLWIRARWICVSVIDDIGILASTIAMKREIPWTDVVGVRTTLKPNKNAKFPTLTLLILLDDGSGLESPIDFNQSPRLFRILNRIPFSPQSQGQRLGTLKSLTLVLFGVLGMVLSVWWVFQLVDQFNQGVLAQGNAKGVVLKIGVGIGGPLASLFAICWGMYHATMRPILYSPGWIQRVAPPS